MKVYTLELSPSEIKALNVVSGRYEWPEMLIACLDGTKVQFEESEAWEWSQDVENDCEGGHAPFPMAAPAFAEKLQTFHDGIV